MAFTVNLDDCPYFHICISAPPSLSVLLIDRMKLDRVQVTVLSNHIAALIEAYAGADKIDNMVLPLPYCQLLKWFELFFVFTLPFVLVHDIGLWTPFISLLSAIGFFGVRSYNSHATVGHFGLLLRLIAFWNYCNLPICTAC